MYPVDTGPIHLLIVDSQQQKSRSREVFVIRVVILIGQQGILIVPPMVRVIVIVTLVMDDYSTYDRYICVKRPFQHGRGSSLPLAERR